MNVCVAVVLFKLGFRIRGGVVCLLCGELEVGGLVGYLDVICRLRFIFHPAVFMTSWLCPFQPAQKMRQATPTSAPRDLV